MLVRASGRVLVVLMVLACLLSMAAGSFLTLAVLSSQRAFPSSGTVAGVNVEVYGDAGCTLNLTSIDWGIVYPAGSVSRTIYVRNSGNVPLTLGMSTGSWVPAVAFGQISLVWDREGLVLASGLNVSAVLTLGVVGNVSGVDRFSVNVVITGSG
jgi:hypothetical protein